MVFSGRVVTTSGGTCKAIKDRPWFCSGEHFDFSQVLFNKCLVTRCKFIPIHLNI
jgi:hypothetical protein